MQSYRFGSFEISLASRELRKDGVLIRLSPQPFQVLTVLIERAGTVVTREELQQLLWADNISVEFDTGLNRCIRQIRSALSDNFDVPRFIETVPRRGYRFIPQVTVIEPQRASSASRPTAILDTPSPTVNPEAALASASSASGTLGKKRTRLPAGLLVFATLTVLATAIIFVEREKAKLPEPTLGFDAVPLANAPGDQWSPSFSPDGRAVAYVWNKDGDSNFSVYVKLVGSPNSLRLTFAKSIDYGPVWSPDGRWIAFCRAGLEQGGAVWMVPALGGPERKIADLSVVGGAGGRPLAWSTDSKWLIVADRLRESEFNGLSLVNVQSGGTRQLTQPSSSEEDLFPSVSSDGATVTFTRDTGRGISSIGLFPFEIDSGRLRHVQLLRWEGFESVLCARSAWTPDGKYLVFDSNFGGRQNLLMTRANGTGKPQVLAALGDNIMDPAISRQGQLAYVHQVENINIWRIGLREAGVGVEAPPSRVIGSTRINFNPSISPSGKRLAFASNQYGFMEIWTSRPDGTDIAQLTSLKNPVSGSPAWSPDGTQIAFDSRAEGSPKLYLVSAGGGVPRKLTTGDDTGFVPAWSADGNWIYYSTDRTGTSEIWRIRVYDGKMEQVTSGGGFAPEISPDGAYILFAQTRGNISSLWQLTSATKQKKLISSAAVRRAYAPAKNGIYYVRASEDGSQKLCFLDLRSGKEIVLTKLDGVNEGLSLSRDGYSLYYSKMEQRSHDLMIVEDFWQSKAAR